MALVGRNSREHENWQFKCMSYIYAYNLLRVLLASPSTNRVFRVISAGLIMRQEDVYQN
jgi:hypothetical protein